MLNQYRSMDDFAKIRMLGYDSVPGEGTPALRSGSGGLL